VPLAGARVSEVEACRSGVCEEPSAHLQAELPRLRAAALRYGAAAVAVVGAALALKGSGRLAIGVLGDGDFLMGNTAVWTATHYQIPTLIVVCNNRSFFNDERHQERVAKDRGRPVENRWIGMRIGDPDIDIAAMARSMGAIGIGPVTKASEMQKSMDQAVETVAKGGVCVVDARVLQGYDAEG